MTWPGGIPGLVRVTDGPVRGGQYDPEAERYVCCGSRQCWWCERGTVRTKENDLGWVRVSVLKEKMLNPLWWEPSISTAYLDHLLRRCTRAFGNLAETVPGKTPNETTQCRVPLRLTGERFDSTDADRVVDLAGLQFTAEDEAELMWLSILKRQRSKA